MKFSKNIIYCLMEVIKLWRFHNSCRCLSLTIPSLYHLLSISVDHVFIFWTLWTIICLHFGNWLKPVNNFMRLFIHLKETRNINVINSCAFPKSFKCFRHWIFILQRMFKHLYTVNIIWFSFCVTILLFYIFFQILIYSSVCLACKKLGVWIDRDKLTSFKQVVTFPLPKLSKRCQYPGSC